MVSHTPESFSCRLNSSADLLCDCRDLADFVIFEGTRNPAYFQNDHWKIWINYDVRIGGDRSCAAWDLQDLNGNDVKSGVWCHGQQPIALA